MSASPHNDRSCGLVVGENGRRCGLAIAAAGSTKLCILVLPKMWRAASGKATFTVTPFSDGPGNEVAIICHEGDAFRLSTEDLPDCDWEEVVDCCSAITRKASDLALARLGPSGMPRKTGDGRRTALIKPVEQSGLSRLTPSPDYAELERQWNKFLHLWYHSLRYRRRRPKSQALEDLPTLDSAHPLLAPLVRKRFVEVVQSLVHHARPGYERKTLPSEYIRGRADISGLALAGLGGSRTVKCTYDAFGLDTPLLRVVMAALREVAAGDRGGDLPTYPEATATASWLLGKFEIATNLSRASAIRVGRALLPRLTRIDGDWRTALKLACLVLESRGVDPFGHETGGHFGWHGASTESYVFDVDTAPLWEEVVRRAWSSRRSFSKRRRKPPRLPAWDPPIGEGMQADIRQGKRQVTVADVKYKSFPVEGHQTPTTQDQRQVFSYSHLYDANNVYLVYALCSESTEPYAFAPTTYLRQGKCHGCKRVKFDMIAARFPSTEDVATEASWNTYMQNLSRYLARARRKRP